MSHEQLVKDLFKDGKEVVESMTAAEANAIHAVMGISGEAGELLDAIKKHVIYKKPLDRENVIEELGDIEFYLQALRQTLYITREQTLAANIAKLSVRYPQGSYSNQDAIERKDKTEA